MSVSRCPWLFTSIRPVGFLLCLAALLQCAGSRAGERSEPDISVEKSCNGLSSEIIHLQQRLANFPENTADQERLKEILDRVAATGAAQDIPSNVQFRDKTGWQNLLPALQNSAWVAVELGHDSNINSGTVDEVLYVPLLNYRTYKIDPLFVQTASPFIGLRLGMLLRYPFGPLWALQAGGMVSPRLNTSQYVYLPTSYEGRLGVERDFGLFRLEAGVGGSQRWLAIFQATGRRSAYTKIARLFERGITAQALIEHSWNSYPQFLDVQTKEESMILSIFHSETGLRASLLNGKERSPGDIKTLDRKYSGYTLSWTKDVFSSGNIQLTYSKNDIPYDETSPVFLMARHDSLREYSLAYEHRLPDNWSITPRYIREENRSSLSIMRYDRTQWMIEARKEF